MALSLGSAERTFAGLGDHSLSRDAGLGVDDPRILPPVRDTRLQTRPAACGTLCLAAPQRPFRFFTPPLVALLLAGCLIGFVTGR
jgi:hypothetical protein